MKMLIAIILALAVGFVAGRLSVRPTASEARSIASTATIVTLDPELKARVQALVSSGETIEAIRLVREETGVQLAVAKAVVDGIANDSAGTGQ
jgi:formaldehyde-activating enzyme involved in methanogenesis